jgi:hypothetical protein
MQIDTALASLIGAAVGGFAGLTGALVTTLISRRSEERKHTRELAMSAAIKDWERMFIDAERLAKTGRTFLLPPMDIYILQKVLLMEAVVRYGGNQRKMEREIVRIQRIVEGVTAQLKEIKEESK